MRVALTGGVGCGVSEAARFLAENGIPVIHADHIGHEVLESAPVKRALLEQFGSEIFTADGEVNRERLGAIIFADDEQRRQLNRIVHPPLLDIITDRVRETERQSGVVVVDAALIFEWGLQGFFHFIIVIEAPLELRIERAMKRSLLNRQEVMQRMAAQFPLEEKRKAAHYLVRNDASIEDLRQRIAEVWEKIMRTSESTL
ncbi:MAG: dephospho-CoA kinase [bacterium]